MFRFVVFLALLAFAGATSVRAQTATLSANVSALAPAGGQVTLTVNIAFTGAPAIFSVGVFAPTGWTYVSGTGEPSIKPAVGSDSKPGNPFAWADVSQMSSPIQFSVVLAYPPGETSLSLTSAVTLRQNVQVVVVDKTTGAQTTETRQVRTDLVPAPLVFGTAPLVTTHPTSQTVAAGAAATFTVAATGTAPLTYQWRKDGALLAGATLSSLSLTGVSSTNAGSYMVTVTNALGTATSNAATLALTAPPTGGGGGGGGGGGVIGGGGGGVVVPPTAPSIAQPPTGRAVVAGERTTFTVVAEGTAPLTYQWRKNGVAIAGATAAAYTIAAAALTDAGAYSVVVTNSVSSATSAAANLEVIPMISGLLVTAPDSRTVDEGASTTFTLIVSGADGITYQWRKDGVAIAGATATSLTIARVSPADAGGYSVVLSRGAVPGLTTPAATLTVRPAGYAGSYFGTFAAGGSFALHVRPNQTGVFLGYATGSQTTFVTRDVTVDASGHFRFTTVIATTAASDRTAAAPAEYAVEAAISASGALTGSVAGLTTFSATRSAATGATQSVAGFYQAGAANSTTTSYAIVSPAGQAFVLTVGPTATDAGTGSVDATGRLTVTTAANATVTGTLAASTLTASVTTAAGAKTDFLGGSEARVVTEKLRNIATRGAVGGTAGEMIAGFVIRGSAPKPVLIRAVGPTLGGFGVAGALTAARLEVFAGPVSVTTNAGWGNSAAISAAAVQVGAFPLAPDSRDAALLLSLDPGAYTVVVSGEAGTAGVALVEVYDASENAAADQRVVNIASRGAAGSGDNTLTAGFVIAGGVPKRVLIRGVGPALGAFGVPGTLADPTLKLFDQPGTMIATNDDWGTPASATAADATQISAAALAVGAFAYGPGSKDAALLLNLAPGPYTVQLSGAGATTGTALVEVYEVP